jgi:hypothetical protein
VGEGTVGSGVGVDRGERVGGVGVWLGFGVDVEVDKGIGVGEGVGVGEDVGVVVGGGV